MPTTSLRPARSLALVASLSVAALALTGCSVIEQIFPTQAERNSETQEVESAGEADVFEMAVGDCLNDQASDTETVETIPAVPCSEPHDLEAYFSYDLTETTFPGQEAVYDLAAEGCYNEFANFVGIAYEESTLDISYYVPSPESWEAGDREVMCLIYDTAPTTGTLAGAAR